MLSSRIGANGDDGVALEGDRLLDRARFVGSVDLATTQDDIGLGALCICRSTPETCDHHGDTSSDQPSRNQPACIHLRPFCTFSAYARYFLPPSRTSFASLMRAAR